MREGSAASAEELGQGLHAPTLCLDGRYPRDRADASAAGRREALEKAGAELTPVGSGPFDAATANGLGSMPSCPHGPRTPVPPLPPEHRGLPGVQVLLLGRDRDVPTPLEWLHDRKRLTPRAQVVLVPGAAHSVRSRTARTGAARRCSTSCWTGADGTVRTAKAPTGEPGRGLHVVRWRR
ncbi:alpha/beta hydrolase [Streptomyces sp. NPDC091412]|uniref:alpha/beta hydrolase n=1 Tax=Streptomyces sp. NPDC091412 TaxID=3366002 RepID=UPI0038067EEA